MRFNVGVMTRPGDRLGFVQPPLRERIVQDYGLDPRLAALAPDDDTLKQYAVRSILQRQEEQARAQREEQALARSMAMARTKQVQETREREQAVQQAITLRPQDMTPVEWEQFVKADPGRAVAFAVARKGSQMEESERITREQAKRKLAREQFEALAPNFPEELHLDMSQALERGADPKDVQRWGEGRKKEMEAAKKVEAENAKKREEQRMKVERGRYLSGQVPAELLGEYQAAIQAYDDPDKAYGHVTKMRAQMEAQNKAEAARAEREEKERRKQEQEALEFDYRSALLQAKQARTDFDKAYKDKLFVTEAETNPQGPQAQELARLRQADEQAQQALDTAQIAYRQALGGGISARSGAAPPPPVETGEGADAFDAQARLPEERQRELNEALKTIPTREGRQRYVREFFQRQKAVNEGWR